MVVVQDEPVKIGEVGQRQRGQRGDVVALEIATKMLLDVAADVTPQMEHFLFGSISRVHLVKCLKIFFILQPVKADCHNSRFPIGTRGDISQASLPCGKPQCLNKRLPKAVRSKVKPRCPQKKSLECAFCSSFKVKMPVLLKQALLQNKQISLAAARLVVAPPVLLFCQLLWL